MTYLLHPGPASAIIYKVGSTYIARRGSGVLLTSGTSFRTVVNSAITTLSAEGGGEVVIEAGTHSVDGTTVGILLRNGVRLRGMGRGVTILTAPDGLDTSIITNSANVEGGTNTNIHISDMTLDGRDDVAAAGRTQGTCISWNGVSKATIRNVETRMAYGSNIQIVESQKIQVSDFQTEGAGNDNIIVQGPTSADVEITNFVSLATRAAHGFNESTGVEIADGAKNVTVSNGSILSCAGAGLTIHNHASGTWGATTGPFNVTVTNVVVEAGGTGGGGIQVVAQSPNGPRDIAIGNCVVVDQGSTSDGFRVYFNGGGSAAADVRKVTLTGCIAKGNSRNGYYLQGTDVQAVGCISEGNTTNGFAVPTSSNPIKLSACTSEGNTQNGYNIASAGCDLATCTARLNLLAGFQLTSAALNTVLTAPQSHDNVGAAVDGIAIGTTTTSAPTGCVVVGGRVSGNGRYGVAIYGSFTKVTGLNSVGNGVSLTSGHSAAFFVAAGTTSPTDIQLIGVSGLDTTRNSGGTRNGLRVQNGTVPITRLQVIGCTFADTRSGGSRTQDNGINFQGTVGVDMATNCTVAMNQVQNNVTSQIVGGGEATNYFAFNTGSGTADIISPGGVSVGVVSKTANYTATDSDEVIEVDATAGNVVISFPTMVGRKGKKWVVIKTDATANTVTLDPDGSETINGATTQVLASQWDTMTIVSNGTNARAV